MTTLHDVPDLARERLNPNGTRWAPDIPSILAWPIVLADLVLEPCVDCPGPGCARCGGWESTARRRRPSAAPLTEADVIAAPFARALAALAHSVSLADLQRLKPYLWRCFETVGDGQNRLRAMVAADWAVRHVAPRALELAGATADAAALRALTMPSSGQALNQAVLILLDLHRRCTRSFPQLAAQAVSTRIHAHGDAFPSLPLPLDDLADQIADALTLLVEAHPPYPALGAPFVIANLLSAPHHGSVPMRPIAKLLPDAAAAVAATDQALPQVVYVATTACTVAALAMSLVVAADRIAAALANVLASRPDIFSEVLPAVLVALTLTEEPPDPHLAGPDDPYPSPIQDVVTLLDRLLDPDTHPDL